MLSNSNLQFTNVTQLNDPFDCHPSLIVFSNVPSERCMVWPAEDISSLESNRYRRNRENAWICSLSKVQDSLLMWSYYNKHQGVCIGLDMEKTRFYVSRMMGRIMGCFECDVQYKDVVEKPDYFRGPNDFFHYQMTTKAKVWEHEQEVRLVFLEPSPYYMMLSPNQSDEEGPIPWQEVRAFLPIGAECFDSLYLGVSIEKKFKSKMKELAIRCNPAIKIYQMAIDPDAFKLKEVLISE